MALGVSVVSAAENSTSDTLDDFLKKSERISRNTQTSVVPFAITTEPTFTINSSGYTDYKNPNVNDTSTPAPALTWKEGNNGLIYLSSDDNTIVENIEINLNQSGDAQLWSGKTLAIRPGFAKDTTVTFNSNGHGIQMGENGDGEFKLQFRLTGSNSPETYINATFSNTTGNDALKGNLKINGGYDNYASTPAKPNATVTFSGNLNGNLIQENTLNWDYTPFSEINFTKGSITGNVDIQIGGITLKFAEGGVKGNVDIFAESTTTTTVKFIRTTGNDLSIGKVGGFIEGKLTATGEGDGRTNFTVGYDSSVSSGDKVISLNPEDKTKFDITRGSFSFYNMKAIKFVDDNGAKKTLTLKDGAVENSTFQFDRSVIADGTTPTIITGNLVALDGKSIRLSLMDDGKVTAPDQSQLKTLRVDGSIVATGSGLSLFYNDRLNCFEAKVEATGGVIQQGGFIGRNDAWFTSTQNATTIQATSGGTSHLIFDKASTISGVDNGSGKLAIRARNGNSTDLKFNGGVNITGNIEASSGTNTITASSFNGSGIGVIATGSGINNITATSGNVTFAGVSSQGYNSSTVGNTINLGSGSITINAMEDGNAVYLWNGGNQNRITASTIVINGNVVAGGGSISNSFSANQSITVNGNITSSNANNFTLTADNASLTLRGENSTITTLTAFNNATNGNTLTLDASNNNSVVATINTLANGDDLKVNFAGINGTKSTQLTLNTANATALKSVSVTSGTNNTLVLGGTGTTTIGSATIGASKAITFDLSSGSNVTFTNLTTNTQGVVTFKLGGTNNTFGGTLTNNGVNNFDLASTTTIQSGTSGLGFSSGENNINFLAGASTLNWKKSDGSAFANISTTGGTTNFNLVSGSAATIASTSQIITDGGTTNINFVEGSASLAVNKIEAKSGITNINLVDGSEAIIAAGSQFSTNGGTANINFVGNSSLTVDSISTASGTTNIKVANGANGILNGVIAKTGGNSVITFLQAQAQGSEPTSSLLLNGATNALTNVVAQSTYGLLASGNSTVNTIGSITLDATGKLAFYNGTSTITTINANSGTLELTTKADAVNTVVNASGISGGLNVLFSGSTNDNYHYSTLSLTGTSNQIASVTSNAKNAVIKLDGTSNNASATIAEKITIGNGNALIFSLVGTNSATATASKGITVEGGGILGISIGGNSGTKSVSVTGGDIDFRDNSTLLIDFQANAGGSVTLGSNTGVITIGDKRNSIINFRGGGKATVNGGIVIDGGNNTINFLGNGATLSDIELKSGNNTINVASDGTGTGITGTIITSSVGSVTNTINLDDNATLVLKASSGDTAGSGSLTSSGFSNTLNFKGDNTTLQGSFGATSATEGNATINVGSADKTQVSGTITGAVSYATLAFNSGNSTLTLKAQENTFKSITSNAQKGVLVLDTSAPAAGGGSAHAVNATISGVTTIGAGKSLSFHFKGDQSSTVTTTGNMTINGTLGIIIDGGGAKNITGNVNLGGGGTLLVDFTSGDGTVTLGSGNGISIAKGESSIINFRGGSATLANAISLEGGTSTINFYRDAEVGGIKLKSGTSIINVDGNASGYTVTLADTSDISSVDNTINLGQNATFVVGTGAPTDSLTTSLSNSLNFAGDDATFQGGFGASGNGVASINVNATGASITGNVAKSSLAFGSNNGTLTLQGTSNTLTTISTTDGATNTLTLDTTGGNNTTKVSGALDASGLSVNLNKTSASDIATLELNGGSLGTINVVGGNQTKNILSLNSGATTINAFNLATSTGLDIQFKGGGLNAVNGITTASGKTFNLSVNGGNSFVSGGNIDANTLSFENNASLAIRSAEASFATVSGNGTLVLDGANGATIAGKPSVKVTLTDVTGNLTAKFNGSEAKGTELVMSKAGQTLNTIAFGANSTNNKLTLATGTTTITDKVEVGNNNAITFALVDGSNLTLSGGMTSLGTSTISSAGDASVTLVGGGVDATKAINLTNLDLQGGTTAQLTIKNAKANISNFNAKKLVLDGSAGAVDTTLHIFGNNLDVEMKGDASNVATLNLNGGTIKSIQVKAGDATNTQDQNIINFNSGTTTITDAISKTAVDAKRLKLDLNGGNLILANNIDVTNDGGTGKVDVVINNATLTLNGTTETNGVVANQISSLSGNGGTIDFVGTNAKASTRASSARKTLTTNTFSENLNAVVFASKTEADQVIVTDTNSNSSGTLTISAQGDINEILSITQDDKVVVAKVGNSNVNVQGGDSVIDGIVLGLTVEQDKTSAGDYLIGKSVAKGIENSIQEIASTALTVNYDLFLANFNSLNKRMGELRDNANSQGVWTRVFGGAMSSEFNTGSKTEYVTVQAGYDYSLTLGDARNYMGIAVAYGSSVTKANDAIGATTSSLSNVNSDMVEVGIYNSYVMDSGWYNDTIFKFDYIMSDFTLSAGSNTSDNSTNNFAMILSDEFGYRYKFAESEKGNWYIDPQVEVAFGYFNQSDFNHALNANTTMTATQDTILTLRTRAGLSLGKKFNTAKGFASLYVGAFYEYDYINGGDAEATLSGGLSGNQLNKLESNGRAIVNIGSNIELTEGVRMYIDVEKSFGDKQRTDMQFNFGARYSFGEKTPTISYQEQQKKRVAPLKVEDKQEANTQESKTEASANTEVK